MAPETATLVIHRRGGWADMMRAYRITVNEIEMGRIKRNSQLELTIPAGLNVIGATIDWTCAQPIVIDASAGETVEIEVSNTYGALGASRAIDEGRDSYLTLTIREHR